MRDLLSNEKYDFITSNDKDFIVAFDDAVDRLGYGCSKNMSNGYCWGRYMLIYSKVGVKNKKVIARIYIRDDGILLRLYLNNVNRHGGYIEESPPHIKEAFTNDRGLCNHCGHKRDGCAFRKTYTIDNAIIDKCSGVAFEFPHPTMEGLPDYINLLSEFYCLKGRR